MVSLAYADDILILSKTAEGLRTLLQVLEMFCISWKMTVNTTKTKCITFQNKNKVNWKQLSCLAEKVFTNVADFVYLGLKINAKGSFEKS